MSDTDEMRIRIHAFERDLARYHDALEEHLYDTELNRIERSHGLLTTIGFFGSMLCAIAITKWLDLSGWVEAIAYIVLFFGSFIVFFAVTEKPMKREIDKIRMPLAWLTKPRWRENKD